MPEFTKSNAKQILIDYLKSHGIKKRYLAMQLGISESTLSYHLGKRPAFTVDFALAVSKALGISPEIFLNENYKKLVTNQKGESKWTN